MLFARRQREPDRGAAEARCNGLVLRTVYGNVGRLCGDEVQARMLPELPTELSEGLHYGQVVVGGWYPIAWLRALHEHAQLHSGQGRELSRRLGYEGSMQNLRGVHRFFISLLDPQVIISRSGSVFRKYYENGKMTILDRHDGSCIARFSDCPGFNSNLWQALLGSCEAAIELSGGQNVRVHPKSGGGDDDNFVEVGCYWT